MGAGMTRAVLWAAIALTALGAAYGKGWSDRGARETARVAELTAARRADAARIMGLAEALERTRAARQSLMEELEDAAHGDHDSERPALPARSVRRIDRR